ncbi:MULTISPECIES: RNA polymerase sigma factor [unclassified Phyllobacterium]|uniref:RNA polymerase sigma factor n=1 Tax=unclassified Phyllobacterium TaxID=2638441 RepID=UPI003012D935
MSARTKYIEQLYVSERPRLLDRISRKIGCRSTASDLIQDLFLRLWEKAPEKLDEPSAYLAQSANNAVIDYVRAQRVRRDFVAGVVPEQYATGVCSPLEAVQARESIRRLDDIIRDLPERTRHIFLLNRVHGRNYAEIGKVIGISRSAVEKHVARAINACREAAL